MNFPPVWVRIHIINRNVSQNLQKSTLGFFNFFTLGLLDFVGMESFFKTALFYQFLGSTKVHVVHDIKSGKLLLLPSTIWWSDKWWFENWKSSQNRGWALLCVIDGSYFEGKIWFLINNIKLLSMAIWIVEFSNGVYKIRKIFA